MLSETIKDAWLSNLQVNLNLLEHLNTEMLNAQNSSNGYTVAQHLAHMVEVTKYWASLFDDSVNNLEDLYFDYDSDTETFRATNDLGKIREVLMQTLETVLQSAESATDFSSTAHRNADAFLMHMIVHDAHHRGQMLLCLKTSNYPLPNDEALWSLWRRS